MGERISLILVMSVVAAAGPLASPGEADLIGQWHFDELAPSSTAFDRAGSNNGTLMGDAFFAPVGISGNAVGMSKAGNGYVTMGDIFPFTSGDFSVAVWVMMSPGNQEEENFPVARHEAGTLNGYFVGINETGPYGQVDKAWFYTSVNAGSEPISTTSVNDGAWHQIVAVYEAGGNSRIYVDGGLAEDSRPAVAVNGNTSFFGVGGIQRSLVPEAIFDGYVDELQIYDHALTNSDVQFLFTNPTLGVGIFADGFESGNTLAWSLTVPTP